MEEFLLGGRGWKLDCKSGDNRDQEVLISPKGTKALGAVMTETDKGKEGQSDENN